jgi:nanoRNase/pAp phosphatase (c-di-AMP/oligoRNAs hydrolase)
LGNSTVQKGKFYATMPEPCRQESPSILADLAMRAEDIQVAVVAVVDDEGCRISVRSRDPGIAASMVVRSALDGIGSGGGHFRGAGGFIPSASYPGERRLRARFFAVLDTLAMKIRSNDGQEHTSG